MHFSSKSYRLWNFQNHYCNHISESFHPCSIPKNPFEIFHVGIGTLVFLQHTWRHNSPCVGSNHCYHNTPCGVVMLWCCVVWCCVVWCCDLIGIHYRTFLAAEIDDPKGDSNYKRKAGKNTQEYDEKTEKDLFKNQDQKL